MIEEVNKQEKVSQWNWITIPMKSSEALFKASLWEKWDAVANILTPQVSTDKSFMNEFPAYDSYYQEMSDEEIEIKLESICERSCSDEEVLSKIEKELRYAWWPPLITSVSCGSMIMFQVMIDGPRGNIIQI